MAIENYPSGFRKPVSNTNIPVEEVEESTPESTPEPSSQIGKRVIKPNMRQNEKNRIIKELRKEGLDVDKRSGKVVPKGYYYTNTGKLRPKGAKYDVELVETSQGAEIITRGKVPSSIVQKGIERYQAQQEAQRQADTVLSRTQSGEVVGTSKAAELQTEAEKRQTRGITAKFINTSEGVKYVGGKENGSVRTGTDSGSGAYDSVVGMDDKEGGSEAVSKIPQGEVKSSVDVFGKKGAYEKVLQAKETYRLKEITDPERKGFYSVVGFGLGVASVPVLLFTRPRQFVSGIFESVTHPKATLLGVGELLKSDTSFFIGQQVGTYGTFKGLGYAGSGIKSAYIKVGSEYVPPEQVFSSEVLQQGKTFPTTSSTSEALQRFSQSDIVGTASPSKLIDETANIGKKASMGLEDPGIYVTPKGEGSPAFLGVSRQGYSFTFNPLKPVIQFFKNPTFTQFKVTEVVKLPREVVSKPGFQPVKEFFEREGSKTGKAYITKRSELGRGELSPQRFNLPSGRRVTESGTSEIEAVIPYSAKFKYTPETVLGKVKGYEKYTTYEGRAIPIREARVLAESDISKTRKFGTRAGVVKEAYFESSQAISRENIISPSSGIKYASANYNLLSEPSVPEYPVSEPIVEPVSESIIDEESSDVSEIAPSESSTISEPSPSELPISNISESNVGESLISEEGISGVGALSSGSSTTPATSSYTSLTPPSSSPLGGVPIGGGYVPSPAYNGWGDTTSSKKRGTVNRLYVKRRGKFEFKGQFEEPETAFKKGFDLLKNTASASLKVVRESGEAILPNILPSDFAKSKKGQGIIIQKRGKRIGTMGEKIDITYKGIRASRLKRRLL